MTIIVQVIQPNNCCQGLKAHPLSGATSTYIKFTVVALVSSQTYYEENVVTSFKSNLLLMIFWLHIINYNS